MTVHEGHRKRLYEKLKARGLLHEHELLEMLLFNAYPRKNTNPIAHALLEAFGSLKGVFEAKVEQLVGIEGVGESVALYLKCVGECALAAYDRDTGKIFLKNYGDFKLFTAERLRGKTEEVLEFYFIDKSGRVKYVYSHTDSDEHRVSVKAEKLSAIIATEKPFGILIAHNHLTGHSRPSESDNKFTGEMQIICSLNGVVLYDHCVYASDNDIFSYFSEGLIDGIKKNYNFATLVGGNHKK